jgi:hypothetical protein
MPKVAPQLVMFYAFPDSLVTEACPVLKAASFSALQLRHTGSFSSGHFSNFKSTGFIVRLACSKAQAAAVLVYMPH